MRATFLITGERLQLRPLELEDAPDLYHYARDPEVARHTAWTAHQDETESRDFIHHVLSRHSEEPGSIHLVWGIHPKAQTGMIGTVSFVQDSPSEAHIDYALSREHWGKGYVTEVVRRVVDWAFRELPDLKRINSGCLSRNIGSVKVLQKSGFSVTERYESRRGGKFGGALLETTLFSLERTDFLE
ncbi:GNAT family N-acetyltransferase [Flavilitoribacter nigricans]|uniref:GNAT family N-acetyltransferase n=1 Tax=Flavilitoribacter nigricans (strain ATCC 23147 / DSM 23189 / NBRC 102662 / NCIMB 1420 / SS-2) TaxID=1122177 RepID=A0A2D0N8C7_FLAN2|nr:GNAT family N-acetyltransferase [Flavilitoribacter nigricans]PHN04735.1 GNAT family N-acetyltransferase [Flavilitoribacter nigricans DSM 23189 = NBRC 102662]